MEIKVYFSLDCMIKNKTAYSSKVSDPDSFSFGSALSVFRSIYGKDCIVVFVCV